MSAAATSGRAQKPSLHAVAMAPRSGAQVRAREPAAVVRPVVLPGLTRQKPKATPRPAVAPRITRQKRKAQSPQQPALRKQPRPVTSKSKKRPPAWNKGRKHSKTSKQHVFIPREQLPLFCGGTVLRWSLLLRCPVDNSCHVEEDWGNSAAQRFRCSPARRRGS